MSATCSTEVQFREYLALPGWGSGSLAAMRRGPPARVIWEQEHRDIDSEAMLLGRFVHCALITPDLLDATFVCKPEGMTFASKEGKAWRAEQTAEIVTFDAYMTGQRVAAAVMHKAPAQESLAAASHREVTLTWDCPISGEACKGRPDWIQGRHIYDLKVSRYADGSALGLRAYYSGWMHQLAHYRTGAQATGLDVRGGRLVVVAPAPPHMVYTLEVKVDSLDLLEIENIATLKAMRDCRLANDWPGTPDTWTKVEPPADAMVAFGEMTLGEVEEEEATVDG